MSHPPMMMRADRALWIANLLWVPPYLEGGRFNIPVAEIPEEVLEPCKFKEPMGLDANRAALAEAHKALAPLVGEKVGRPVVPTRWDGPVIYEEGMAIEGQTQDWPECTLCLELHLGGIGTMVLRTIDVSRRGHGDEGVMTVSPNHALLYESVRLIHDRPPVIEDVCTGRLFYCPEELVQE